MFKELVKHPLIDNFKIIGTSTEKFIGIETDKFIFVDSYAHLIGPLQKIVDNLMNHDPANFVELRKEFSSPVEFQLMLGKGSFCYEYLDNISKLHESCPTHDKFFSSLKNENISDEEYSTVQKILSVFDINTIGELLELYVKQDCLILCDVINHYRTMVRTNYSLEALCYYTSPALTFDAALRMTRAEIELLQDSTMYMFFEKGIRGGIATASRHYFKANNMYIDDYNPENRTSYIFYGDVTNLYGYCLSQQLAIGEFSWVNFTREELISKLKTYNHKIDSHGYVMEVDLEIPNDLHDFFEDYPPMPENITITRDMLSPWSNLLYGNSSYKSHKKLAPNLYDKNKYICHIANLQYYVELGIILKKHHRVLSFRQSDWLREYIEFNTLQRVQATSDVERDFFKLLINGAFGRCNLNFIYVFYIVILYNLINIFPSISFNNFLSQPLAGNAR